jgi:hypothetical protein
MMYSDDPSSGPWMDREWLSFLTRQLEGEGVRVLPARIGHSKGPALLRDIKYADLASSWDKGIEALDAAMGTP